jgi:hypothetical protein
MKFALLTILIISLNSCSASSSNGNVESKQIKTTHKFIPNQFQSLWQELQSNKYIILPQYKLSYSKIKDKIEGDAIRTLEDKRDLLPNFDKLAHPNGICLNGVWNIDTPNLYSGYFKDKSKALVIARVSTAFDGTKYDDNRAFGIAIKLFPTTNPEEINTQSSANIFLIDDLGGNKNKYFHEVELTNEPPISFGFDLIKNMFYNIKLTSAFNSADKNAGIRQLYEISELEDSSDKSHKPKRIKTPKWIKLNLQTKVNIKDDFRDELLIENEPLVFSINVASKKTEDKVEWIEIGTITFSKSLSSYSCDHRLHFHHPKFRDDLEY